MRSLTLGVAIVTIVALGLFASLALSKQDQPKSREMPTQQEMMQMMEAMGKVGPQHEQLKKQFAGTWNADVTAYWGPTPEKSTGTMTSEMMFGGRFVHGLYKGTAMGQPFEGASLTGYDNMKKKYFSSWVDSMSTGLFTSEGSYDESTKTYTFTGESIGMDGQPSTVRQVVKVESDDKHTFSMFGPGMDGKETKMMEIVYTRKK